MQEINQSITIAFVNINYFRFQSQVSIYSLFHASYITGRRSVTLYQGQRAISELDVPCQPCGDEGKYDDKEQGAVHVGKALHLGGRLVYPGRLGEPAPGIHLPLVALVFRVFLLGSSRLAHG